MERRGQEEPIYFKTPNTKIIRRENKKEKTAPFVLQPFDSQHQE